MRRGNLNANSFYNVDNREIVVTLWVFCDRRNARSRHSVRSGIRAGLRGGRSPPISDSSIANFPCNTTAQPNEQGGSHACWRVGRDHRGGVYPGWWDGLVGVPAEPIAPLRRSGNCSADFTGDRRWRAPRGAAQNSACGCPATSLYRSDGWAQPDGAANTDSRLPLVDRLSARVAAAQVSTPKPLGRGPI